MYNGSWTSGVEFSAWPDKVRPQEKKKKYYTRCIQQTPYVCICSWVQIGFLVLWKGWNCKIGLSFLQNSDPVLFIIHYECCRYHNHSYLHNSFESQQGIAVFHQELNIEQFWVASIWMSQPTNRMLPSDAFFKILFKVSFRSVTPEFVGELLLFRTLFDKTQQRHKNKS